MATPTGKQFRNDPIKQVRDEAAAALAAASAEIQAGADATFLTKAGPLMDAEAFTINKDGTRALTEIPVSKLTYGTGGAGDADATLAAPTADGAIKLVTVVGGTGTGKSVTLAGTNLLPASDLVFTAVGDFAYLVSAGGKWLLVGSKVTVP